jgi:hypothetical protein
MSNKAILLCIVILLGVTTAGYVYVFLSEPDETIVGIVNSAFSIATLMALYLIVTTGTMAKTAYWRFIMGGVAVLMLGAVFKVLHLTGAAIGVTYLVRFIRKETKGHLDILKLAWVIAFCLTKVSRLLHLIPEDYHFIADLLFWAVMVDFAYLELKKSPPDMFKR